MKNSIFSLRRFISCFVLVGFVVTCSVLIFLDDTDSFGNIYIANETISSRAIGTALNTLFLCLFFSIFEAARKKVAMEKPLNRILEATHRITNGDFSARIEPVHEGKIRNEFDIIIEDFNKMAQELSSSETLKTDFIANVSHELKTPLTVIHNYATMLQKEDISDKDRMEYAKILTQNSKKLSDLITSILRLSKLENQQIFPVNEKYNLNEQLCECLLKHERNWEEKNLEIETDFDDEIIINADKELFDIVWSNLISNAVKFTPDGGKISVQTKADKDSVSVRISDTGCGMNRETGNHIFEKFYQGDASHTTNGNGLGLALVKRVIFITNSEIIVESTLNKGSSFTVVLPVNS